MSTKLTSMYILTLISIGIVSNSSNTTLLVVKAFMTLISSVNPIVGS